MGGSSSKQKKSRTKSTKSKMSGKRPPENHIGLQSEKQSKGKKNKQSKNVTIQDDNADDNKSIGASPSPKIKKSISFSEKSINQIATPPPVYRKKSMCYPCDVKDFNFEDLRNRSGSDKSLRFSDFNKLVRQTTLYDWEMAPADIPLYNVPAPRLQSVCYICGVYTGSVTRACKTCYQVYHDGCLSKIGHALDKKCRLLTESNSWSCHQCGVLSHLLTREDVQEILGHLQDLQMNPDGITIDDYIRYYEANILGPVEKSSPVGFETACKDRFKVFDEGDTGSVDFDQFLDLVAINTLQKRSQCSLVHILTEIELTKARTMFQSLEEKSLGKVTTETAYNVIHEFDAKTKEIYRPIEDCIANTDDEKRSLMSWGNFISTVAIHLLVQRPNYSLIVCPPSGDTTLSKTQSFDSIEDDFRSCDSTLDAPTNQGDGVGEKSKDETVHKGQTLPFNSGTKITAIGVDEDEILAPAIEEDQELDSTSKGHLWSCQQSRYRQHTNFSQRVISFTKTDCGDSIQEITLLETDGGKRSYGVARDNRRSEILVRPENQEKIQKRRAVSQKVVAPSFGRLVDRVQQEDWC